MKCIDVGCYGTQIEGHEVFISRVAGGWGFSTAKGSQKPFKTSTEAIEAARLLIAPSATPTATPREGSSMPRPTEDEVNDRIHAWHEGNFADGVNLHTVLGWTKEEYNRFVADPSAIPDRPLRTVEEIAEMVRASMRSAQALANGAR